MGFFDSIFKSKYENLEVSDFKSRIQDKGDNAVILDVRTIREVKEGAIEGHVHMDFYNDFENQAKTLNPEKHYFVYCRSGNRSGQACQLLHDLGFKNVSNLSGGYMAWARKYGR